jgi:hypothetical protein
MSDTAHTAPNLRNSVQLMPGGTLLVYIITIEASLLPPVRALLEDRLGRKCEYVQGSFLVYGNEVDRLLSQSNAISLRWFLVASPTICSNSPRSSSVRS